MIHPTTHYSNFKEVVDALDSNGMENSFVYL